MSGADRKTLKPPPKAYPGGNRSAQSMRRTSVCPPAGETQDESFLVTLSFAYSLAEKPDTSQWSYPFQR